MMYDFDPTRDLPPTRFLEERIPDKLRNPSLRDPQFRRSFGGVTIFLANGLNLPNTQGLHIDGVDYHYSTGIIEQKVENGEIKQSQVNRAYSSARFHAGYRTDTAAYHEFFIQRAVDDRRLRLQHLIANVSRMTGQPFFIYGTTLEIPEE